jgi:L-asparaginase
MSIRILVTGGTFDKEYNERTGQLYFKDTHIAEMLRLGRSRIEVTIRTVMMIDSLEMTDTDRTLIVQNCLQSEENRIVITHGTDTMTDTAAALARAVPEKTVVLTGAMIPYAFGSSSILAARFRSCRCCLPEFTLPYTVNAFRGIASGKTASAASSKKFCRANNSDHYFVVFAEATDFGSANPAAISQINPGNRVSGTRKSA